MADNVFQDRITGSKGGTWGEGKNNAVVFNMHSGSGTKYRPIGGTSSLNGIWSLGTLGSDDNFYFYYNPSLTSTNNDGWRVLLKKPTVASTIAYTSDLTLNTAGATNKDTTGSLYIIGAPTQESNPQTYTRTGFYLYHTSTYDSFNLGKASTSSTASDGLTGIITLRHRQGTSYTNLQSSAVSSVTTLTLPPKAGTLVVKEDLLTIDNTNLDNQFMYLKNNTVKTAPLYFKSSPPQSIYPTNNYCTLGNSDNGWNDIYIYDEWEDEFKSLKNSINHIAYNESTKKVTFYDYTGIVAQIPVGGGSEGGSGSGSGTSSTDEHVKYQTKSSGTYNLLFGDTSAGNTGYVSFNNSINFNASQQRLNVPKLTTSTSLNSSGTLTVTGNTSLTDVTITDATISNQLKITGNSFNGTENGVGMFTLHSYSGWDLYMGNYKEDGEYQMMIKAASAENATPNSGALRLQAHKLRLDGIVVLGSQNYGINLPQDNLVEGRLFFWFALV